METAIIMTHADEYPRWTQRTTLSGVLYELYFNWIERTGTWTMSVLDASGTLLLGGIRLVPGIDLLAKYRVSVGGLPAGKLIVIDRQNDPVTAELDRNSFGERFLLGYFDFGGQ